MYALSHPLSKVFKLCLLTHLPADLKQWLEVGGKRACARNLRDLEDGQIKREEAKLVSLMFGISHGRQGDGAVRIAEERLDDLATGHDDLVGRVTAIEKHLGIRPRKRRRVR
jgi:hypothetical protein